MNAQAVLELVAKGMALIEAYRSTLETLSPAIKAIYDLVEKQKSGAEVTDAELKAVEDVLDAQLLAFNAPLPE